MNVEFGDPVIQHFWDRWLRPFLVPLGYYFILAVICYSLEIAFPHDIIEFVFGVFGISDPYSDGESDTGAEGDESGANFVRESSMKEASFYQERPKAAANQKARVRQF